MRFLFDGQYINHDDHLVSIDHTGHPLAMIGQAEKRFLTTRNGNEYYKYFDLEPGLVEYGGASWLVSHATRYVDEDGTVHCFIPTIGKYIHKRRGENDYSTFGERIGNAQPITIDGFTHLTSPDLRGRDISGAEVVYTNVGKFWRSADGAAWQPALANSTARFALGVGLVNPGQDILVLFFEIYDTPPARRWLELFRRTQGLAQRGDPLATAAIKHQNVMYGYGRPHLEACVARINHLVGEINARYTSRLATSDNSKLRWLNPQQVASAALNQLHHEFEAFGDRFRAHEFPDDTETGHLHGLFSRLNNSIHACEGALINAGSSEQDAQQRAHINFFPDIYDSLNENDYQYFTQDFKFGELYMGYHTLGKDFMAVYGNDDADCVMRHEVRPQRIANTEVITWFGPDLQGEREKLREWWAIKGLDSSGYDLDDPTNAIGLLPIGRLAGWRSLEQVELRRTLAGYDRFVWGILFGTRFEV
jgi:hypothetical protein